ncbi:unnamed protein product [Trichobilharzia szidati]|nr:unnamed protein product [Trichobilharzia szidati]
MHGVAHLVNLTILNLPNNGIVSIDGLIRLTRLRWLNLSGNKIKVIEQLEKNTNLKHLDLSDNYISELSDLSFLVKLKTLLLHCNHITTIQNASKVLPKSLEIISLASNVISNILEVQELSCLTMLMQFSLRNNPCAESTAYDHKMFVLGWLPNLHMFDGFKVTSEDVEKAKYFISGLRFSLTLPSSKSSQEYDYTVQKDHINQCQMKATFPNGIDHNLNSVCNDNPQSSYIELSTTNSSTISQNYSSDSLSNRMSGTCNGSCGKSVSTFIPLNVSTGSRENHFSQSITSLNTAVLNNGNNHTSNNNNDNNSNIHVHQGKYSHGLDSACNNTMNSTDSTISIHPKVVNICNNYNNDKDKSQRNFSNTLTPLSSISPSSLLPSTHLPVKNTNCLSEKIVKSTPEDQLFTCGSNSCHSKLDSSPNHLLSSDSVYLPLDLSKNRTNTNDDNKVQKLSGKNIVGKPYSTEKRESSRLSPNDTLLSSRNFIPLNKTIHRSHSPTNSLHNSKANATSKPLKESLIDGVHLIVDDDDNDDGDDGGEEEEVDVFTEGTVQTTKFIHPLEDDLQLQPQESNITHQNGSSHVNMGKPLMNSNYDDNAGCQYSSSILRKDFKSSELCSSLNTNQTNENSHDNIIATKSEKLTQINHDLRLPNGHNNIPPELCDSVTPISDGETNTINNGAPLPVTQDAGTLTDCIPSISSSSTQPCCSDCCKQKQFLEKMFLYFDLCLEEQSMLIELQSKSMLSLVNEVCELKSWKESVMGTISAFIHQSANFPPNSGQTDNDNCTSQNPLTYQSSDECSSNTLMNCAVSSTTTPIEENGEAGNTEGIITNDIESDLQSHAHIDTHEENHIISNYSGSIDNNAENDQLPSEIRKSQQRVSTINNSTTECSEISELQHTLRVNYNNNDGDNNNSINNERSNSSSSNGDHNNNFYHNNTSTECIISMHTSNAIEINHQGSGSHCDVQYSNATNSPVGVEDSPDDNDDDDDDNNNIEHVRQVLIQAMNLDASVDDEVDTSHDNSG